MRLTRSCLPIGKYCSIVALQNIGNDRRRSLIVDVNLAGILSIGVIISELLGLFLREWFLHGDLVSFVVNPHNLLVALSSLFLIHGSASDGHLHGLICVFQLKVLFLFPRFNHDFVCL